MIIFYFICVCGCVKENSIDLVEICKQIRLAQLCVYNYIKKREIWIEVSMIW